MIKLAHRRSGHRLAAGMVALVMGCAGPQVPLSAPAQAEHSQLGAPRLVLASLSPPVGAIVDSATVIRAGLRYTIPDTVGHPGPYSVGISFKTSGRGSIRPATPEERYTGPQIQEFNSSNGYVEVSYPIALIWRQPEVQRPFQVVFTLTGHVTGSGDTTHVSPRIELRRVGDILAQLMIEYAVASR